MVCNSNHWNIIQFTCYLSYPFWITVAETTKPAAMITLRMAEFSLFAYQLETTMTPFMPASKWPGMRQPYSKVPGLENVQMTSAVFVAVKLPGFGGQAGEELRVVACQQQCAAALREGLLEALY